MTPCGADPQLLLGFFGLFAGGFFGFLVGFLGLPESVNGVFHGLLGMLVSGQVVVFIVTGGGGTMSVGGQFVEFGGLAV
jgi:hypothetical protein